MCSKILSVRWFFLDTSLKPSAINGRVLYEKVYCAYGEMENRIKEQHLDLFVDLTSAASLRANQLRLWLAAFAHLLINALNISDRSNRMQRRCFSKLLYKHRNLIERFFNIISYFRRLATRYDKLGSCFLAMLKLTALRLWLRRHESTV